MKRMMTLLALALLFACGESKPGTSAPQEKGEVQPPIPDGMVRIRTVDLAPDPDELGLDWWKKSGWTLDWLAEEGWAFFGWRIEAVSSGVASVRWHDPRVRGRELGTVSVKLSAGKPALLVYGVRVGNLLLGPLRLTCGECGAGIRVAGDIWDESAECGGCGTRIFFDAEWSNAQRREYRLFVFGGAGGARGSRELKSKQSSRFPGQAPTYSLFGGSAQRRDVMDPTEFCCDPLALLGYADADYAPGAHVIARKFQLAGEDGFRHTVSTSGGETEFEYVAGDTEIRGEGSKYAVTVAGRPVETTAYPRVVWEFELTWKRE